MRLGQVNQVTVQVAVQTKPTFGESIHVLHDVLAVILEKGHANKVTAVQTHLVDEVVGGSQIDNRVQFNVVSLLKKSRGEGDDARQFDDAFRF